MKYAGVMQEQCPLKAIVTIGNPYDLQVYTKNYIRNAQIIFLDGRIEFMITLLLVISNVY